jgi:hypothetical protein
MVVTEPCHFGQGESIIIFPSSFNDFPDILERIARQVAAVSAVVLRRVRIKPVSASYPISI